MYCQVNSPMDHGIPWIRLPGVWFSNSSGVALSKDYFCLQETQTIDQNCVALDEDRNEAEVRKKTIHVWSLDSPSRKMMKMICSEIKMLSF